ncbi:hypothetical protein [Parasitella parasitica]|uniref:Uncharacterized protein n=1 Tax=Parasitella parasitica TaxID=35722 RepID=A0A0B7N7I7_9FUNG|nr:hypothetical protein [Parasitella parasitica]
MMISDQRQPCLHIVPELACPPKTQTHGSHLSAKPRQLPCCARPLPRHGALVMARSLATKKPREVSLRTSNAGKAVYALLRADVADELETVLPE